MRRTRTRLAATVLTALTLSGTGIAAASAQLSPAAIHRRAEHFTFILTSTNAGEASVIATGLFTDGGTINIFTNGPSAAMKLGAGTIRLTTTSKGLESKTNPVTCLTTVTGRGTYNLGHGTGKYIGIRGSGHYTVLDHVVSRREPGGGCVTTRSPLAVQAIFTFSGWATLHR
jgi:hypothetical protein